MSGERRLEAQDSEALERRLEELRFLGTHFAMGGVEPPEELSREFEAIQDELRRRAASKGDRRR